MVVVQFPPLSSADKSGLLAVGGDLEPESLLLAYSSGIFPWPYDARVLAWYSPPRRAILHLNRLHISRSLQKDLRTSRWQFSMNRNPREVIESCRDAARRNQPSTWITDDLVEAYLKLHELGYCHSFECYERDMLIGGLYGIQIKKMFAGESMFYRKSGASKLAFLFMTTYLYHQNITWLDCQVMTPHMRNFGAEEISRDDYITLLERALE